MTIISMWAAIFLMISCTTTVEVLPGLCYDSRSGTTLCGPVITPDEFPPQEPIKNIWEECKPFLSHPVPAWSDCIQIA